MSGITVNDAEIVSAVIYTFVAFVLMATVLVVFFYFSRKKILQATDWEKRFGNQLSKRVIAGCDCYARGRTKTNCVGFTRRHQFEAQRDFTAYPYVESE